MRLDVLSGAATLLYTLAEQLEEAVDHGMSDELRDKLNGMVPLCAEAIRAVAAELDGAEPCGAGHMTGVMCDRYAETTVEYMPIHLRDAHEQARNRGTYPANGAERWRVCRECADAIVSVDPDWTSEVTP